MADELVTEQPVTETAIEPTLQQQIAEQMNFRLNGEIPKTEEEPPAVTEAPVTQTEVPEFKFTTFTEKYGWQTPEDAAKEIEELRQFKAAPQTATEIKYENEQSKKVALALQEGNFDEVYEVLNQQHQLDKLLTAEVNKGTANDIIKLSMQLKYKEEGLTAEDVNYKFGKMYKLPKEPVKGDLDDDTEFEERHNEWKDTVQDIEAGKIIDAKIAKKELEAAKSKLVLPEIAGQVDEEYVQWQKLMDDQKKLDETISTAYQNITTKDVETKIDFNDEPNKISFQFQYEPSGEELKQTAEYATDINKLLQSYVSDGKFDKQGFLKDIHFAKNREKVLMEAMKQSKNAAIKRDLPDNSNSGIGQRQLPQGQQEPDELQKQMRQAGVIA